MIFFIFFISEREEKLDINSDLKTQGGYSTCLLMKANGCMLDDMQIYLAFIDFE